jgi:peptidoglycan/xylan/chitin deacetylase (PgdA/CDA1 family)
MINALKTVAKSILSRNLFLPVSKGNRYIFVYHDISEPDTPHHISDRENRELRIWPYSYRWNDFKDQIEYIARHFDIVSLEEILNEKPPGRKRNWAAITFDDGYQSVYERGMPFLFQKGLPFAVFINQQAAEENRLPVTDQSVVEKALFRKNRAVIDLAYQRVIMHKGIAHHTFEENPLHYSSAKELLESDRFYEDCGLFQYRIYMSPDTIQNLFKRGIIIGSHSASHTDLYLADENLCLQEMEDNQEFIRRLTGSTTLHFAFPWGKYTQETIRFCIQTGHKWLYGTELSGFRFSRLSERTVIPRCCVYAPQIRDLQLAINLPFVRRRRNGDSYP